MRYILLLFLLIGCANTPNGAIDLTPSEPIEYNTDFYGLKLESTTHLYKDDFKELLIKTHGERVAMYCIEHYRYETISVINRPDTTYYIVR